MLVYMSAEPTSPRPENLLLLLLSYVCLVGVIEIHSFIFLQQVISSN